ncbi:helix-turn-helix domain-containing protein [Herbiconiux sp. L3-i23]|uniref:helix-turn-helix domain-containing protein n=1 Tax=Herbiconiux sp. L3-i23 TaxID=2905871 RepID=UPI00204B0DC6|nr:helix-turn-helix domain-containing protein [Herbiconiux sp. L3-i23]BDI23547.1 hypothetical protein L3i23_23230 [Herbiconiux sp. L3-i23]
MDIEIGNAGRLLTLDETAEILRKTPAQLRYLLASGQAPKHGKIGGRIMFRRSDVEAFIEAAFAEASA